MESARAAVHRQPSLLGPFRISPSTSVLSFSKDFVVSQWYIPWRGLVFQGIHFFPLHYIKFLSVLGIRLPSLVGIVFLLLAVWRYWNIPSNMRSCLLSSLWIPFSSGLPGYLKQCFTSLSIMPPSGKFNASDLSGGMRLITSTSLLVHMAFIERWMTITIYPNLHPYVHFENEIVPWGWISGLCRTAARTVYHISYAWWFSVMALELASSFAFHRPIESLITLIVVLLALYNT